MTKIRALEWFIMFSQATVLIAFNVRLGEVLGGSMVFLIIIAILFYFSYVHRVLQEQLTALSFAALCVIGLNIVAYYEQVGTIHRLPILIGYFLISLVFLRTIYEVDISLIRVPKKGPPEPDPVKRQLIRNIAALFLSIPTLALLLFAIPSGLAVWINQKSRLVQAHWLTITGLAILWQVIGALVHKSFLSRITNPQIVYVLKLPRRIPIANFKQRVVWGLLLLLILGSLGEIARGLWFFWLGSFAFWTLTLQNSWKVWKHIFGVEEIKRPAAEVAPEYEIVQDFRLFLYSAVIAAAYLISLALLLGLTVPKRF